MLRPTAAGSGGGADTAVVTIRAILDRSGGITRTRTLTRLGVSERSIRRLLASGALLRPRRGWVALADADPELFAAARAGGVVTCVTRARRLGLWVLADEHLHVAVAPKGRVPSMECRVHWAAPLVLRHPDSLEDSVEDSLVNLARCVPYEGALATWESAARAGLVSFEAMRRLPLHPLARRLCDEATPWSDSGLETIVIHRLRWMGIRIVPQAWIAGHRVDFLLGDRLVLQIDGGHHVGRQRATDVAHDTELLLRGYRVIRVTYAQVIDGWPEVQAAIMRAVAQGLHQAA